MEKMDKTVIYDNIIIEDNFNFEGEYEKYLIVIFGLRRNVKYFQVFDTKREAIVNYGKLFHYNKMFEKDFRGLNLISGITSKCNNGIITIDDKGDKPIKSAFNNNFGIMYLIGFNSEIEHIHIGFADKSHNNIITISNAELSDDVIKYKKKLNINYRLVKELKN